MERGWISLFSLADYPNPPRSLRNGDGYEDGDIYFKWIWGWILGYPYPIRSIAIPNSKGLKSH